MTIYELDPSFMDIVQMEFTMMDNTSSLPACLGGTSYPPPMANSTKDGGAFHVLEGEKKIKNTLIRS